MAILIGGLLRATLQTLQIKMVLMRGTVRRAACGYLSFLFWFFVFQTQGF